MKNFATPLVLLTTFLTAFAAMLLLAPRPVHAQGLGLAAGLNFNDMDDIETDDTDATFDNSTGYHFGLYLDLGAGSLSLRPGVFYHRLGTYDFPAGEELDLAAIEVPVDVRWRLLPTSPLGPYLLLGPVITFPRADEEFDEAVEDLALTADVGAGVELSLAGLTLMPELRYGFGVTDYLSDDFEIGSVTVDPSDDDQRMSKVMLRLNVTF